MNEELGQDQAGLSILLEKAVQAATAPADNLRSHFRNSHLTVQTKQDGSPVSVADREAEEIIREVLGSRSLGEPIDILGEEQGFQGRGTRFRWTIDPIDGTRSFIRGIPLFGTIVALEDTTDHRAMLGVIHLPELNVTLSSARGLGSWRNGKAIHVSAATRPDQAIMAVGDPLQFSSAQLDAVYQRLYELCPCLRGYTDCFGHALVASGSVCVMLDPALNPWDVMATQVLVEEAGGTMVQRPSAAEGKVDALFGNSDCVKFLSEKLSF